MRKRKKKRYFSREERDLIRRAYEAAPYGEGGKVLKRYKVCYSHIRAWESRDGELDL